MTAALRHGTIVAICAVLVGATANAGAQPSPPAPDTPPAIGTSLPRGAELAAARALLDSPTPREADPRLRALRASADADGDHRTASLAEAALGRLYSLLDDRTSADSWFDAAEARTEAHALVGTRGTVVYQRGLDAYGRGLRTDAAALWRRAVPYLERAGAVAELASVHSALGYVVPPAEARPLLERAVALAREARVLSVLGRSLHALSEGAFVEGRWAEALSLVDEALPALDAAGTPVDRARARISRARLLRFHGDREEALVDYGRARILLEPVRRSIGLSSAWATLSSGYQYFGDSDAAIPAARRALAVAQETGNQADAAFAALAMTEALLALNRAAEAVTLTADTPLVGPAGRTLGVRRAYALSRLDRHAEAMAAARAAEQVQGSALEATPVNLATLAEVHRRAGDVAGALNKARQAVAVLEQLRGNAFAADQLRVGFDDGFQWVHGRLVRLLVESGQAAEALVASERARARAFADVLASRNLPPTTALADVPTLDTMMAEARRLGTTIVAYWTDDQGVLMWAVTPTGLAHYASVAVSSRRLGALVARTWSDAERTGTVQGRRSVFRELHDLLVRPLEGAWRTESVARITIVPHGPLFRLSFAGTQRPDGRFLVEHAAVSYAPSIAVLGSIAARPRGTDELRGFVVAAPSTSTSVSGKALPPLPGAAAEGRAVARRLGIDDANVLTRTAATEPAVRAGMATAAILHFATHAVVVDDRPMLSFLALAGGTDQPDADGRLTAEEVYGLSLSAQLVVLSGCRTASGRITGDGVIGLSRAFFAAGAASVVASLWDLPDVTGRTILPAFYDAWALQGDKALALRDAQLSMLRALRAGHISETTAAGPVVVPAHPAIWSGLVLMGAP